MSELEKGKVLGDKTSPREAEITSQAGSDAASSDESSEGRASSSGSPGWEVPREYGDMGGDFNEAVRTFTGDVTGEIKQEVQEDEAKGEERAETVEEAAPAGDESVSGGEAGEEEIPKPPAFPIERVQGLYPDRVIESEEQFFEAIASDRKALSHYAQFEAMVDQDQELFDYIKRRLAGEGARSAALKAFDSLLQVPDEEEDPDAYREFLVAEERKKWEKEQADKERSRLGEVQARAEEDLKTSFADFAKQMKWDRDQDLAFRQQVQVLINGDQAGRYRSDVPRVLYRGLHFDRLLAEATKQAKIEGRNEVIAEREGRRTRKGDGLPKPKKSKTEISEPSREEKQLARMAKSFSEASRVDYSWPPKRR